MSLVRLLLYTLATLAGLYVLAAVLYAIPVISGLLSRLAAEMHAALEPRVEDKYAAFARRAPRPQRGWQAASLLRHTERRSFR